MLDAGDGLSLFIIDIIESNEILQQTDVTNTEKIFPSPKKRMISVTIFSQKHVYRKVKPMSLDTASFLTVTKLVNRSSTVLRSCSKASGIALTQNGVEE